VSPSRIAATPQCRSDPGRGGAIKPSPDDANPLNRRIAAAARRNGPATPKSRRRQALEPRTSKDRPFKRTPIRRRSGDKKKPDQMHRCARHQTCQHIIQHDTQSAMNVAICPGNGPWLEDVVNPERHEPE